MSSGVACRCRDVGADVAFTFLHLERDVCAFFCPVHPPGPPAPNPLALRPAPPQPSTPPATETTPLITPNYSASPVLSDSVPDPKGPFLSLVVVTPGVVVAQPVDGAAATIPVAAGDLVFLSTGLISRLGTATSAQVVGVINPPLPPEPQPRSPTKSNSQDDPAGPFTGGLAVLSEGSVTYWLVGSETPITVVFPPSGPVPPTLVPTGFITGNVRRVGTATTSDVLGLLS